MLVDEEFRILPGIADMDDRVESDMWHCVAKQMPEQRTLANLASAGYREHWKDLSIAS